MGLRLRSTVWCSVRGLHDPKENAQGFVLLVPAVYQVGERELMLGPLDRPWWGEAPERSSAVTKVDHDSTPQVNTSPKIPPSLDLSCPTSRPPLYGRFTPKSLAHHLTT